MLTAHITYVKGDASPSPLSYATDILTNFKTIFLSNVYNIHQKFCKDQF